MAEISISKVKVSWFPLHFLSFAITSPERAYPSRNAPCRTSPPSYTAEWAAGVNKRRRWAWKGGACGQGRAQRKNNLWAGCVGDTILRDDFPALDQYSSTDAKRMQASKV